jgi:NTE family protein
VGEIVSAIQRRDLRARSLPSSRAVLGISSLGFFLAFLDATIVNIAFPDIAESFPETDIAGLSWILNAYNVVFAAFLLPFGRIADVFGRRRIFLVGLALFTGGSLLCALAWSVESLVAFRVVQALGAAAMVPAGLALVLHGFEAEQRSHAVALISAIGALAAGLGPAIGGLLIAVADWRLVFVVNLPLGTAAYVLASRHLVESREAGRRRLPDMLGASLFAVSTAALVVGIVNGAEWGWTSAGVLACLAGAAVGLVLFAIRCSMHACSRAAHSRSLMRSASSGRPGSSATRCSTSSSSRAFGTTPCSKRGSRSRRGRSSPPPLRPRSAASPSGSATGP